MLSFCSIYFPGCDYLKKVCRVRNCMTTCGEWIFANINVNWPVFSLTWPFDQFSLLVLPPRFLPQSLLCPSLRIVQFDGIFPHLFSLHLLLGFQMCLVLLRLPSRIVLGLLNVLSTTHFNLSTRMYVTRSGALCSLYSFSLNDTCIRAKN
jgi:hypothetical protein